MADAVNTVDMDGLDWMSSELPFCALFVSFLCIPIFLGFTLRLICFKESVHCCQVLTSSSFLIGLKQLSETV